MAALVAAVEPHFRKIVVMTNFEDICQSIGVEPTTLRDYLGEKHRSTVHIDPLNRLIFDKRTTKSLNVRKTLLESRDLLVVDLPIDQFKDTVVQAHFLKGTVLANYEAILNSLELEDSRAHRTFFGLETRCEVNVDGRGGLVFEGGGTTAPKIASVVRRLRNWRIHGIRLP